MNVSSEPEVVSIPLPRLSATERDTVNLILASTARNWEADICNLLYMSEVSAFVIEETLSSGGSPGVNLSEAEANRLLFVAYETHRRLNAFSEKYHAALKA